MILVEVWGRGRARTINPVPPGPKCAAEGDAVVVIIDVHGNPCKLIKHHQETRAKAKLGPV